MRVTSLFQMRQVGARALVWRCGLTLWAIGSGKTLAFLLPIMQQINNFSPRVQCVVVVPTRELSIQTHAVCSKLTR